MLDKYNSMNLGRAKGEEILVVLAKTEGVVGRGG
jgi:hypothetical protein